MKEFPETSIEGEIPIAFSYQVAPLIIDLLAYPELKYKLYEIDGHNRLNFHTILTPSRPDNPEDYPKILPLHVADIVIGAENAGEYWRNQIFEPSKPWRIRVELKQRAQPYEREVKVSYRDPLSRPLWESRKWFGPVDDADPEGLWMTAKRDWEIRPNRRIARGLGLLLEGVSILEAGDLRNVGRALRPVELSLFSRAIDDRRETTVFYDDDDRCLSAMYMDRSGIQIRRANRKEMGAWDKANNLHWGEVDWSLLESRY